MRFSSTALLPLLASSALAAPAKPNNANLVVSDINTISAALVTLNNTLNSFKPFDPLGVAVALKIQSQAKALNTNLQTAITDTEASRAFGEQGTNDIATVVLGLVDPINSVLTNIVAHKPAFATGVLLVGDLSKTVYNLLLQERNLTATLGNDIAVRLSEPYKSLAPQIVGEIVSTFDTAIAKYKSCTGLLCLPPI